MSSEQQIEANRLNAQKSTGPATPEGRAAVSLNGLKYGLYAKTLILPGEEVLDLAGSKSGERFSGGGRPPRTPGSLAVASHVDAICTRITQTVATEASSGDDLTIMRFRLGATPVTLFGIWLLAEMDWQTCERRWQFRSRLRKSARGAVFWCRGRDGAVEKTAGDRNAFTQRLKAGRLSLLEAGH